MLQLSTSEIINLSPKRCASLRSDGTLKLLVSLLHSHNTDESVDKEAKVKRYLREATLKRQIGAAIRTIIATEHKLTDQCERSSDRLELLTTLERLRGTIDQQYELSSKAFSTCKFFSRIAADQ